jgi:hypothetical protein
MKLFNTTVFSICMLFCVSICQANQAKLITSPDGKFSAHITISQNSTTGPPEFKTEIRDSDGQVSATSDYTSENGEQGLSLVHAAWTPDSQFFIFTTYSSGGHMAWQYPTLFFDRRDKKIHDFNEFLPPIAEGTFKLKAPDIITITIWTPLTTEIPLDESIDLPITFRMSDLKKSKKSP